MLIGVLFLTGDFKKNKKIYKKENGGDIRMKKEDFFVSMDDILDNGIHTPGNLHVEFDWKFFDLERCNIKK